MTTCGEAELVEPGQRTCFLGHMRHRGVGRKHGYDDWRQGSTPRGRCQDSPTSTGRSKRAFCLTIRRPTTNCEGRCRGNFADCCLLVARSTCRNHAGSRNFTCQSLHSSTPSHRPRSQRMPQWSRKGKRPGDRRCWDAMMQVAAPANLGTTTTEDAPWVGKTPSSMSPCRLLDK
jgi:hypothetical protein